MIPQPRPGSWTSKPKRGGTSLRAERESTDRRLSAVTLSFSSIHSEFIVPCFDGSRI